MAEGFVPSWIQPADEVGHLAQGYQVGMALGARQAEQAFREQQMMRQQQLDAQQKAQWEAEFGLQSAAAARKAAAVQAYQADIAAGVDPVQAIVKHGPAIGLPGGTEAAALRSMQMRQPTGLTGGLTDIGGGFKAFQTGPNTRTLVRPQESATGELMPATTPDGTVIPNVLVSKKGQIVHIPKPEDQGKLQRELVKMKLSRLQKTLESGTEVDKQVTALMARNPKLSLGDADTQVRQGLEKQIKDLEQQYLSAGGEKTKKKLVYRDGQIVEE